MKYEFNSSNKKLYTKDLILAESIVESWMDNIANYLTNYVFWENSYQSVLFEYDKNECNKTQVEYFEKDKIKIPNIIPHLKCV